MSNLIDKLLEQDPPSFDQVDFGDEPEKPRAPWAGPLTPPRNPTMRGTIVLDILAARDDGRAPFGSPEEQAMMQYLPMDAYLEIASSLEGNGYAYINQDDGNYHLTTAGLELFRELELGERVAEATNKPKGFQFSPDRPHIFLSLTPYDSEGSKNYTRRVANFIQGISGLVSVHVTFRDDKWFFEAYPIGEAEAIKILDTLFKQYDVHDVDQLPAGMTYDREQQYLTFFYGMPLELRAPREPAVEPQRKGFRQSGGRQAKERPPDWQNQSIEQMVDVMMEQSFDQIDFGDEPSPPPAMDDPVASLPIGQPLFHTRRVIIVTRDDFARLWPTLTPPERGSLSYREDFADGVVKFWDAQPGGLDFLSELLDSEGIGYETVNDLFPRQQEQSFDQVDFGDELDHPQPPAMDDPIAQPPIVPAGMCPRKVLLFDLDRFQELWDFLGPRNTRYVNFEEDGASGVAKVRARDVAELDHIADALDTLGIEYDTIWELEPLQQEQSALSPDFRGPLSPDAGISNIGNVRSLATATPVAPAPPAPDATQALSFEVWMEQVMVEVQRLQLQVGGRVAPGWDFRVDFDRGVPAAVAAQNAIQSVPESVIDKLLEQEPPSFDHVDFGEPDDYDRDKLPGGHRLRATRARHRQDVIRWMQDHYADRDAHGDLFYDHYATLAREAIAVTLPDAQFQMKFNRHKNT